MENYGDIHLHHSDYPDFPGTYSYEGQCRYSPFNQDKFDKYEGSNLGVEKCHVEYCHPGSWQGKQESQCDGVVKNYEPNSTNQSCSQGVFGEETGKDYSNYVPHQSGTAFAHGPGCGCPGCSPVAVEGSSDLMGSYQTLVWLFALIVAFILGRKLLKF